MKGGTVRATQQRCRMLSNVLNASRMHVPVIGMAFLMHSKHWTTCGNTAAVHWCGVADWGRLSAY